MRYLGPTLNPTANLLVGGNASITGTVTGSNLSGTNTGDQTNITGHASLDLPLTGGTLSGDLTVSKAVAPLITLNPTADAVQARVTFQYNGSTRWTLGKTGTSETGSNVGSDFSIRRYADAGTFIDDVLTITRSTGAVTILNPVTGASFIPSSSTAPTNGMYLYATNAVGFSTNSTGNVFISAAGNIGVGIAPVSGVKSQVKVGSDQNVGCLTQSSMATICGLTDAGSSTSLRVSGNSLYFCGNGSTEHFRISNTGALGIGGANYGSSGQVMTSNGSAAPAWVNHIEPFLLMGC